MTLTHGAGAGVGEIGGRLRGKADRAAEAAAFIGFGHGHPLIKKGPRRNARPFEFVSGGA